MALFIFAVYPDIIKGMSVNSGRPCKCATSVTAAYSCMGPGANKSP